MEIQFEVKIVAQSETEVRFTIEKDTTIRSLPLETFLEKFNETSVPGVFISAFSKEEISQAIKIQKRVKLFSAEDILLIHRLYIASQNPPAANSIESAVILMILREKYQVAFPEDSREDFMEAMYATLLVNDLIPRN